MGIMDNEGHDPMGFGNIRSASRELDIETLTRPGGIVPVDIRTTAELVRHVIRLRAFASSVQEILADCQNDFHACKRCGDEDNDATKESNLYLLLKSAVDALTHEQK